MYAHKILTTLAVITMMIALATPVHGQGYAELRGIISRHFVGESPYMLARDESVFTGACATRRIK